MIVDCYKGQKLIMKTRTESRSTLFSITLYPLTNYEYSAADILD